MKIINLIHNKKNSLLFTILICIIIFYFSSKTGNESKEVSNNFILRKLGHFLEYFFLGYFFHSFLSNINYIFKNKILYSTYTAIFIIFYAISDELHQFFIPNRTASVIDVIIDFVGGLFGIFCYKILKRLLNF